MRHGVYDILDEARHDSKAYTLPMGATLEPCSICHKHVERVEDAIVWQERRDGPALMAHSACHIDRLQKITRAMGRTGSRKFAGALRLER